MTEIRYQVFVSSTYTDLKEERRAVSRAILSLGHFPAGMELFPATDDEQFEYIKSIIDNCDYYLLIIGGSYGSLTKDGISYTEKEYEYAVSKKIPVCAFVHSDTGSLMAKDVDHDPELKTKLDDFRSKVTSGKIVKFWDGSDNLEAHALLALTNAINTKPQIGWKRGDIESSRETLEQIDRLNQRLNRLYNDNFELRNELRQYKDISTSSIEIRIDCPNGLQTVNVSGEKFIRHFASALNNGIHRDEIEEEIESLIRHVSSYANFSIDKRAVDDVVLFFQVFELIGPETNEFFTINEDKKFLLKAAFLPLSEVVTDDEIPF